MKLNKFNNYHIWLGSELLCNTTRMRKARKLFKKEHPDEDIRVLDWNVWNFWIDPRGKDGESRKGTITMFARDDKSNMKEATNRILRHLARHIGFSNLKIEKTDDEGAAEVIWEIHFNVCNSMNNIQAIGVIQTALSEHKW